MFFNFWNMIRGHSSFLWRTPRKRPLNVQSLTQNFLHITCVQLEGLWKYIQWKPVLWTPAYYEHPHRYYRQFRLPTKSQYFFCKINSLIYGHSLVRTTWTLLRVPSDKLWYIIVTELPGFPSGSLVSQQCVVYSFQCGTCRHLHQRIGKSRSTVNLSDF